MVFVLICPYSSLCVDFFLVRVDYLLDFEAVNLKGGFPRSFSMTYFI